MAPRQKKSQATTWVCPQPSNRLVGQMLIHFAHITAHGWKGGLGHGANGSGGCCFACGFAHWKQPPLSTPGYEVRMVVVKTSDGVSLPPTLGSVVLSNSSLSPVPGILYVLHGPTLTTL